MNVFHILFSCFIKFSSRRSIPIEQVRRANFIWPFSDQDDFTIRINTNMPANNILANRCSYSCSIPSLSCFDNISDDINTFLSSKVDLRMDRFDMIGNHFSIFKISSTCHSTAESLNR